MHELIERITTSLQTTHPHIRLTVNEVQELTIYPEPGQGFEILVQPGEREHTMHFDGWHFHFDDTAEGKNELLEYLSYGLSKTGRLKIYSRSGQDYKWTFEVQGDDGQWQSAGTLSTFDLRFWLKPQIRYLQNDLIAV